MARTFKVDTKALTIFFLILIFFLIFVIVFWHDQIFDTKVLEAIYWKKLWQKLKHFLYVWSTFRCKIWKCFISENFISIGCPLGCLASRGRPLFWTIFDKFFETSDDCQKTEGQSHGKKGCSFKTSEVFKIFDHPHPLCSFFSRSVQYKFEIFMQNVVVSKVRIPFLASDVFNEQPQIRNSNHSDFPIWLTPRLT